MALVRTPSGAFRERTLPQLDVETQIYLAEQSGQLSGPGYDIEALKASGLVLPSSTSPTGVRVAPTTTKQYQSSTPDASGIRTPRIEGAGTGVVLGGEEISLGEGTTEQKVTIPLTQSERDAISAANTKATCAGEVQYINVYKISGWDDNHKWVSATVEAIDKDMAKKKAINAGYDVKQVTRQLGAAAAAAPQPTGLAKYKDPQGNYDIIGVANAYRTHEITGDELDAIFGAEGSHEVAIISDVLTKLEPYKTGDGYLLSAALADRTVDEYELGKIFNQAVVDNAVTNRGAAATLSRYKDTSGNYDLIAISEAVGRGTVSESAITSVLGADVTQDTQALGTILKKLEPYKTEEGYLLTDALQKGDITEAEALRIFNPDTIAQSTAWIALSKALTPEEFRGGTTPTVSGQYTATKPGAAMPWKQTGIVAAEIVVPYLYTIRHWDEMPTWEKALWITVDTALFILPMVSAGVRGARGVAVAAQEAGRLARVGAAAKNIGREAFIVIKAPVETILHPIAATKQGIKDFRSVAENVLRPKRIPEAVLTTTEGTVRLSITDATSVEQFMATRDELIRLAARGQTPLVQLRNKAGKTIATLELQKAPLMRELGGGMVHTTPWGEQFRAGLTVEARANMPLAEQGLFVSHEPLPRFATQSAFNLPVEIGQEIRGGQTITTRFGANQVVKIHLQRQLSQESIQTLTKAKLIQSGDNLIQPLSGRNMNRLAETLRDSGNIKAAEALGETVTSYKPVFRIMDTDKAKEIIASGKTYRGAVEMEARLPVGTKIQPPKQILVTRIGSESTEVQLWLDKALSSRQIMKLKAEGLLEAFRQPFRFPLKIRGKLGTLTPAQIDDLARTIRGVGNPDVARNMERAYQLTRSAERMAQVSARAASIAVTRAPERITAITRAKGIQLTRGAEWLERAERPERITRTRTGQVVRRAPRAAREERLSRTERVERVSRTERIPRTGRIERVERPERERVERVERIERPVRGERPIRPIRSERPVRPIRPIRPTKFTKTRDIKPVKGKQKRIHEGPALAVWKQGAYWVSIFPPFRTTGKKEDVVYSRTKPPWGSVIVRGRHAPKRTLRSMGHVPELITVPMGVVTARIRGGRHLSFSRSNGGRRGRIIE